MKHFQKIASGIDVAPVMAQLAAHPELWNQNRLRKDYDRSPHREMDDIWVRARPITGDALASYSEPHYSEWWPAFDYLTALQPMIFDIMAKVRATHLGGILITKIPAGKRIYPHTDKGHWHAEFHNCKVYLCLQGNDDCVTRCEDERVVMQAGEAWIFNNQVTHSLDNEGNCDRISVIIAMRVE